MNNSGGFDSKEGQFNQPEGHRGQLSSRKSDMREFLDEFVKNK